MLRRRAAILLLTAALALAGPSMAADPKAIFGSWIERLPNGGGMVTTFTDTTISAYGVNAAGQPITTPNTMKISYRDLGPSVGVDFEGGGGLLVAVRSPTAITVDFPDAGAHDLTPWRPPPQAASKSKTPKASGDRP